MTNDDRTRRRVLLHAGFVKTGSTTVQNALAKFRDRLEAEAGVIYPGEHVSHNAEFHLATHPERVTPAMMIGQKSSDPDELAAKGKQSMDALERQIAASAAHTVVFSSEGTSKLFVRELERLRAWIAKFDAESEVLVVVREPVAFSASGIQQMLKAGSTLEQLFRNPVLPNFEKRLGSLIEVFGRERVKVYAFEELARGADGMLGCVLPSLELPAALRQDLVAAQTHDNPSLSHAACVVLSTWNRQRPLLIDGEVSSKRTMAELGYLKAIKGPKFTLPRDVARRVYQRSRDDVAWLNETFGLELYQERPPQLKGEANGTSLEETLDIVTETLGEYVMRQQLQNLRARLRRQRQHGDQRGAAVTIRELRRIEPNVAKG